MAGKTGKAGSKAEAGREPEALRVRAARAVAGITSTEPAAFLSFPGAAKEIEAWLRDSGRHELSEAVRRAREARRALKGLSRMRKGAARLSEGADAAGLAALRSVEGIREDLEEAARRISRDVAMICRRPGAIEDAEAHEGRLVKAVRDPGPDGWRTLDACAGNAREAARALKRISGSRKAGGP